MPSYSIDQLVLSRSIQSRIGAQYIDRKFIERNCVSKEFNHVLVVDYIMTFLLISPSQNSNIFVYFYLSSTSLFLIKLVDDNWTKPYLAHRGYPSWLVTASGWSNVLHARILLGANVRAGKIFSTKRLNSVVLDVVKELLGTED
jgi:hypothetical protein